jgi:hypothetical protein
MPSCPSSLNPIGVHTATRVVAHDRDAQSVYGLRLRVAHQHKLVRHDRGGGRDKYYGLCLSLRTSIGSRVFMNLSEFVGGAGGCEKQTLFI